MVRQTNCLMRLKKNTVLNNLDQKLVLIHITSIIQHKNGKAKFDYRQKSDQHLIIIPQRTK